MEIHRDEMGSQGNVVKSVKLKTVAEINIHEWLLVEVLIRLPVKLVFRSKLVCKHWLSVILDPSFVRMYISRASVLQQLQPWTFISCNMHVDGYRYFDSPMEELLLDILSRDFIHPSYYALPLPCTQQSDGKRYSIVGVSNGLVLYGPLEPKNGPDYDITCYSICNPITGKWITLPPHVPHFQMISSSFVTRVENGILTSYRVVRLEVPLERCNRIKFRVFLSEIGEWKNFVVCIDRAIEVTWHRTPTSLNGVLHWITHKHGLIAYDPYHKPNSLGFIALPGDIELTYNDKKPLMHSMYSLCDVHQGRLRYFETSYDSTHPHGFSTLGVWILNDYNTGDWCLQHRVDSSDIIYDNILPSHCLINLEPISFHPFDSDIVYLGYSNIIVSYNINTRKLEAHGGPLDVKDIGGRRIFFNFMNWPSWWRAILLMIPPWPIYIPPTFRVMKN